MNGQRQPAATPWWKRAIDITLCLLALILLGPLMLVAAVAILVSSPGPLFYVAPRMGRGGRPFGQLKFRSMHWGADAKGAFTEKNDARIFWAGRVIRLFKIDELPQIFNILRGEMSVVGPRPEDTKTVENYYTDEQRRVLDVLPGLTGLPQVRFFPELSIIDPDGMDPQEHYCRIILPLRLEMDLEYIRRQSFWFDLRLIVWTVSLILVKAPLLALGFRPEPVKLESFHWPIRG